MSKINTEMAEQEFDRFAERWDIETNTARMNEESAEGFQALKDRIVRAIEKGRATIGDKGNLTYALYESIGDVKHLDFSVPKGSAYMEMDNYKDKQSMRKLFAFMGGMTKQDSKIFAKMDGVDVKFCQGVATLFMVS